MKLRNQMLKYVAPVLVLAMPLAHATAAAQPDTTDSTAYITAGIATILVVFTAKFGVKAAMLIARWVQGVLGR